MLGTEMRVTPSFVIRIGGRGESRLRNVERMWWRVDGDNRDGKQPPVSLGIRST